MMRRECKQNHKKQKKRPKLPTILKVWGDQKMCQGFEQPSKHSVRFPTVAMIKQLQESGWPVKLGSMPPSEAAQQNALSQGLESPLPP